MHVTFRRPLFACLLLLLCVTRFSVALHAEASGEVRMTRQSEKKWSDVVHTTPLQYQWSTRAGRTAASRECPGSPRYAPSRRLRPLPRWRPKNQQVAQAGLHRTHGNWRQNS